MSDINETAGGSTSGRKGALMDLQWQFCWKVTVRKT